MKTENKLSDYPSAELYAEAAKLTDAGETLLAMVVRNAARHAEQREQNAIWEAAERGAA